VDWWNYSNLARFLQTPHFPPSFAQCLQYLQFLQAWQGSEPVQVDEKDAKGDSAVPKSRAKRKAKTGIEGFFILVIVISP
jgi:hypothetical protein